jgi:Transposase DDE domain
MAVAAAGGLPAALDGLQYFPRFPAPGHVGDDLGRLGREASPSAGVIDSQCLKSAEKGGVRKEKQTQVGYDAGKRVKGRKVHALVDTEGLPLRVIVIPPGSRTKTAPSWFSTAPGGASTGLN